MIGHIAPSVKASPRLGFQFHPLPVAAVADGLPSTAAILFAILIDDAKRRGWRTRLLNPALAARLGRSVATVKRLLALLESRGLIQREHVADGRVRVATRITWAGVAHSQSTDNRSVAHSQPRGGSLVTQEVAHSCATNSERSQNDLQTAGNSTSDEGEKRGEPTPSPAETAAALRAMVAGKWAPMIFDEAKPEGSNAPTTPAPTATSPAIEPTPKADAPIKSSPARSAPPARAAKPEPRGGLDLRRVGVSAVAAAYSPAFGAVRNTPESLMKMLRERRKRVGPPSPVPIGAAPKPEERPTILPNPSSRGALANPGKL